MSNEDILKEQMLINEQYLIIKKIGQGGFGIVWLAYDFSLKNFVAIKELLPQFAETKFIEMFYKEALIAKNLIHDNIVRVQHFWKGNNNSYYIVMDYVKGRDLGYVLKKLQDKKEKFPQELAVFAVINILKALDYLSRLARDPSTDKPYGIVFRDLSPGNIMLFFNGGVKLSDFGIAKTAEELGKENKEKIITGKYAYMSPEQIKGTSDIDCRSDIFSAGIVLYEMLLGIPLFNGDNKEDIRKQVLESKFNAQAFADSGVAQDLIYVIGRSLEKERDDRHQTALEMFRDLRRLLKGRENEELILGLSNFMGKILQDELSEGTEIVEFVNSLNLQDIKNHPELIKINCRNFIMGEANQPQEAVLPAEQNKPKINKAVYASKVEERGKTVFEEVGDWFVNNFRSYKKTIFKILASIGIAIILLIIVDTFFQVTFVGRFFLSYLYPPDVIVYTIPTGSDITVKTREGKIIASEVNLMKPLELRKVVPQTYIISAFKDGFNPIERIVKIEDNKNANNKKIRQEVIIIFDSLFTINSEPQGADLFLNSNKVGKTPWKGEISAGEYAIKLYKRGLEDIGSDAKESKPGQCNIDLTSSEQAIMFNNVDTKFWTYNSTINSGARTYNLVGHFTKKISFNSYPKGVFVYVNDELQPRGTTPINISLRMGDFNLKFIDASNKYQEKMIKLKVDENSDSAVFTSLNKWITFRVNIKGQPEKFVEAILKIKGPGTDIKKSISSNAPFRVALPIEKYQIQYFPGIQYSPVSINSLNIIKESVISVELEPVNMPIKITVLDSESKQPLQDADIVLHEKIIGHTDVIGVWESSVKFYTNVMKISAKGYLDKKVEKNLNIVKKEEFVVYLQLDPALIPKPSTAPVLSPDTVTCRNCGKEYPVNKKPRFCINCGKLLR